MTTVLMVVHIIIIVALIGFVLLQKSDGGGALGMGSSSSGGFMTARGTANFLTRTTAILAALFFASTLILALVFKGSQKTKSILTQEVTTSAPTAPEAAPVKPVAPSAPVRGTKTNP